VLDRNFGVGGDGVSDTLPSLPSPNLMPSVISITDYPQDRAPFFAERLWRRWDAWNMQERRFRVDKLGGAGDICHAAQQWDQQQQWADVWDADFQFRRQRA
jgi:hypothetical protein